MGSKVFLLLKREVLNTCHDRNLAEFEWSLLNFASYLSYLVFIKLTSGVRRQLGAVREIPVVFKWFRPERQALAKEVRLKMKQYYEEISQIIKKYSFLCPQGT